MIFKMLCMSILLLLASVFTASANVNSMQDRAVAEVTRLGGKIEVDETLPGKPIVKVDLHSTQVTDLDLVFLKDLIQLRALDLRLTQIGDAGVANLKKLTKLQTLNLFRTQLSDVGLAHLKK